MEAPRLRITGSLWGKTPVRAVLSPNKRTVYCEKRVNSMTSRYFVAVTSRELEDFHTTQPEWVLQNRYLDHSLCSWNAVLCKLTNQLHWEQTSICVEPMCLPEFPVLLRIIYSIAFGIIVPSHKSHSAPDKYSTIHHVVTEKCTCVHISVTTWCIVGCWTGALWDLCNRSIGCLHHQYVSRDAMYTSQVTRRPVMWSLYIFLEVGLKKLFNKESSCHLFGVTDDLSGIWVWIISMA